MAAEIRRALALRDGLEARLLDPQAMTSVPAREVLARVLDAVAPVAADLGGGTALMAIDDLTNEDRKSTRLNSSQTCALPIFV